MDEWTLRRHIAEVLRTEGRFGFRGEISSLDDAGEFQTVTGLGLAGEEFKAVHRVQPHGFASAPPVGSHHLVFPLGGERILAAALGGEHQDKRQKNLPTGTAVLYDDQGNCIRAYGADGLQLEAAKGHVWAKPAQGSNVYLGGKPGDGGTYAPVQTAQGPSSNVFARVG